MKYLVGIRKFAFYVSSALVLIACAHVSEKDNVRTDEEIDAAFDRNKADLYSIYQGFLHRKGAFGGRLLLKLTIEPSGRVSECGVHQSTLNDPVTGVEMGKEICARVMSFDFGAKNMDSISITYPIDFLPKQ